MIYRKMCMLISECEFSSKLINVYLSFSCNLTQEVPEDIKKLRERHGI